MLIPPVRRTWAPKGSTQILRHHHRRDRISVIASVTVNQNRQRLALYFRLHENDISHDEVYDFLWWLLKHIRGHILVILDNARIHNDGSITDLLAKYKHLHREWFPAYAPELNPAEPVWSQTKQLLSNGRSNDTYELGEHLIQHLQELRQSQSKLLACVFSI